MHETMDKAIRREKQIKDCRRLWKIRIIEEMNPEWRDLFDDETGEISDGPVDVERLTSDPSGDSDPTTSCHPGEGRDPEQR